MGMTRQYLEQLADSIGPRPVASDTERDAAEWIRQRFTEHGLNTTIQDFDSIRSLSGAHLLYALVSVASVVLLGPAHKWAALCWLLWILILLSAIFAWLDFSGRGSLSRVFPKGPSQNVVGRYSPIARPGEEVTKVVLVAHYDSDRATPLASDTVAPIGRVILWLAHGVIMALPILALVAVLPLKFLTKLYPYSWYVLMVVSIPVLIMLLNLVISALIKRYSPGANNNASGVAALLSICEDLAEGSSSVSSAASSEDATRFGSGTLSSLGATGTFGAVGGMTGMQPPVAQQDGLAEEEGADFDTTFDFGVAPREASGSGSSRRSRDRVNASAPESSYQDSEPDAEPRASKVVGTYGSYDDYDAHETFADTDAQAPQPAPDASGADVDATAGATSASTQTSTPAYSPFSDTTDLGFGDGIPVDIDTAYAASKAQYQEQYQDDDGDGDGDQGAGPGQSLGSESVLGADVIAGASANTDQFTESFGAVNAPVSADDFSGLGGPDDAPGADEFAAYAAGVSSGQITRSGSKKKKKGLFGRGGKKKDKRADEFSFGASTGASTGDSEQASDWLGVDTSYDAREEGRKIGSWDNFPAGDDSDSGADDFDDGFSWKGGAAEGDVIEDGEYASTQAARIRRKVSEMLVTRLGTKELWFVATSAHYVHSCGMRTFLEDYHEELRGALIINLDALGSGDLYWSVMEQAGKTYKSSARLTASARRVAREKNIRAKPYKKGKLRTEAGWALADGRKAVSIMRLTESGAPFAQGSPQDVPKRLSVEKIDEAVEFVVSLIQEL